MKYHIEIWLRDKIHQVFGDKIKKVKGKDMASRRRQNK